MSVVHKIAASALVMAGVLSLGAVATAGGVQALPNAAGDTASASPSTHNCFYLSDWDGWRSPRPDVIYLRVRISQIFRVDLNRGSSVLQDPFAHLVNREHGDDSVCNPIDLNLSVSNGAGIHEPLFAKAITRLTPQQIAALPSSDLP